MSLRMKLLVAQVPLAVALAVVGVVAALRVSSLGQRSGTILHENYRSVLAAERMRESLERLQDRAVLSLVTGVSTDTPATTTHAQQFEHELRAAEANITEVGEGDALRELRRRWEAYRDQLQRLVTLQAAGDARELVLSALEPAAAAVRQQAQLILEINQDAMVRKSERAQQEAARVGTLLISAAVGALLLGVLLSGMVTSRLLQPFELLARTVARLGEGDFDTRVNIAGNDEVARLAKDINAMATHLGQYRRSSLGELLLAQEASQAAIDSLPDPVAVFDLNGSVLNANRAAETAIGLKLDAGEGGPLDAADADVRALLEASF